MSNSHFEVRLEMFLPLGGTDGMYVNTYCLFISVCFLVVDHLICNHFSRKVVREKWVEKTGSRNLVREKWLTRKKGGFIP